MVFLCWICTFAVAIRASHEGIRPRAAAPAGARPPQAEKPCLFTWQHCPTMAKCPFCLMSIFPIRTGWAAATAACQAPPAPPAHGTACVASVPLP
ncbi:MAG: hypothetical protein J3K34DRAFT_423160 [Monoraphidium minutum]|nr:MAG: hypothetical protein J3K34DRAFT_423160 [Monoraphidium minutum]